AMILAARKTGEKSGREQIARARDIRHLRDWFGLHRVDCFARNDDAAFFAARHHRKLGLATQRFDRSVEVSGFIKTVQFALVGENDIDEALADQIKKLRAVTVDTERIRQ